MKTDDLLRKFASIVFVHGLTGNRETTWTHKEAKVFWPQAFLARDLPNTRILTFGYDADIVHSLRMAGSNTLRDNGKSLAHDLALRRMRSRTDRQTSPKIRVCFGCTYTDSWDMSSEQSSSYIRCT